MEWFNNVSQWVIGRAKEATTWDGFALVGVALVYLLFPFLMDVIAWVALGYGGYRIFKSEVQPRL